MTTIAEAARAAREKREKREAEERAAAEAKKAPPEEKEEPGFFQSFFGRADTIDAAVDKADAGKRDKQKNNQSTDSNN